MKKLALLLFVAVLFTACNYRLAPKEEKTQTVFIIDVATFNVDGKVAYMSHGRIQFTDTQGRVINTHISKCVIIEQVPAPVTPPAVQSQPPEAPQIKKDTIPKKE